MEASQPEEGAEVGLLTTGDSMCIPLNRELIKKRREKMSTEKTPEQLEAEAKALAEKAKSPVQDDQAVKALQELKATTVARDKYDKDISQLQQREKQLLDLIKNGGTADEDEKSIEDLRNDLAKGKLSNLEYCQTALSLRSKVLSESGKDIFEAEGHTVDRNLVDGERVADFMQSCIDRAEGDSKVFTALLQSNLVDKKAQRY